MWYRAVGNLNPIFQNSFAYGDWVAHAQCADRRDRIYSIVAIDKDAESRGKIPVDYTISVAQLFVNASLFFIRNLWPRATNYYNPWRREYHRVLQAQISVLLLDKSDFIGVIDLLISMVQESLKMSSEGRIRSVSPGRGTSALQFTLNERIVLAFLDVIEGFGWWHYNVFTTNNVRPSGHVLEYDQGDFVPALKCVQRRIAREDSRGIGGEYFRWSQEEFLQHFASVEQRRDRNEAT